MDITNNFTLLITVTVFADITRLAYSLYHDGRFIGETTQGEATAQMWWYLTEWFPASYGFPPDYRLTLKVIDRRPEHRTTGR